jgi:hypothetical protein
MMTVVVPFQTERTEQGEQCLVPGVAPITQRQRLEWTMAHPLEPRRPQKLCNDGLFDFNARNQLELF